MRFNVVRLTVFESIIVIQDISSELRDERLYSLLFDENNEDPLSRFGVKSQGWFTLCSHSVPGVY